MGLNFFDLDQKGSISPSECPELSARLFAMLDVNHHGLISHSDLQQAIDGMMEEMDHKLDHIKALDRDIDELRRRQAAGHTTDLIAVQVAQNEATLEELRKEVDERKRVLQSIFHYFHTAFALHVFGVTGRDLQYRPVDIRSLVKELERVEKEANEDPLQVDEKATVFRREEHGQPHALYKARLLSCPTRSSLLSSVLRCSSSTGSIRAAGHAWRWSPLGAAARSGRGADSGVRCAASGRALA